MSQYFSIHAGNPYADYRNRSLWGVLGAALCHPDDDRAREFIRLLAIGALAPNPVRFTEGLALAMLALKVRAGSSAAKGEFETKVREARDAAAAVDATLGDAWADAWGNHCRRLAVLAEGAARALERFDLAEQLLEQARSLPFGFAGYQAPASLFLAEANRVCRLIDSSISETKRMQLLRALVPAAATNSTTLDSVASPSAYRTAD